MEIHVLDMTNREKSINMHNMKILPLIRDANKKADHKLFSQNWHTDCVALKSNHNGSPNRFYNLAIIVTVLTYMTWIYTYKHALRHIQPPLEKNVYLIAVHSKRNIRQNLNHSTITNRFCCQQKYAAYCFSWPGQSIHTKGTHDIVVIIQAAYNLHHINGMMHTNNTNNNCLLYASFQRVQTIHKQNMQNTFKSKSTMGNSWT